MKRLISLAFVVLVSFYAVKESDATSQWARKYGVSCQTCHTAYPRLNYFGDKFALNGLQMPGTDDGDDVAKQIIGNNLNLNELTDIFGIRVSVTPIAVEGNGLEENGKTKTSVDIGNPNAVSLYTAGTIFKNTSVQIETEVDEDEISNEFFQVAFHNLFGTSLLNVRVGKMSTWQWNALSKFSELTNAEHEILSDVQSANGTGDDSVSMTGPVPAIGLYGWKGPFVLEVGVSNGAEIKDPNDKKNFWGMAKYYVVEEGDFAGSAVSLWGLIGTDTKQLTDEVTGAPSGETEDDFWRLSPAVNIRYLEKWDLQFAYFFGHDDDFDLSTMSLEDTDFQGIASILGYTINEHWYCAFQADWVHSSDASDIDHLVLSPAIWYFPRDNMRIGLIGHIDAESEEVKKHVVSLNIDSMF
ncbi:MAG: hypothetical protein HYS08_05040 [Chlamydiae bacterium]|nr:hypothetical protein [Chlamydiota bacterium]MBI3267117.1 hypothetical protein [Chlamydiota bacterium]